MLCMVYSRESTTNDIDPESIDDVQKIRPRTRVPHCQAPHCCVPHCETARCVPTGRFAHKQLAYHRVVAKILAKRGIPNQERYPEQDGEGHQFLTISSSKSDYELGYGFGRMKENRTLHQENMVINNQALKNSSKAMMIRSEKDSSKSNLHFCLFSHCPTSCQEWWSLRQISVHGGEGGYQPLP